MRYARYSCLIILIAFSSNCIKATAQNIVVPVMLGPNHNKSEPVKKMVSTSQFSLLATSVGGGGAGSDSNLGKLEMSIQKKIDKRNQYVHVTEITVRSLGWYAITFFGFTSDVKVKANIYDASQAE